MLLHPTNVESESDPVFHRFTRRQTLWLGYLLGPVLVGVTTYALLQIQSFFAGWGEHIGYFRPYGIIYILPVLLAALFGGRGPGILTLVISEAVLTGLLIEHGQPSIRHTPRDWAELTILPIAGAVIVVGAEALRYNTYLLVLSQAAQARTRAIMGSAPVGIAVISTRGEIQFANRELERICGHSLTGQPLAILTECKYFAASGMPLALNDLPLPRVLSGVAMTEAREMIIERPAGDRLWIEQRATMVQDEKRRMQGTLLIVSDITERKDSETKLRARMEREAVMNRIAVAIRNADAPELIQETAAASLGVALGADRCYFVNIDQFDGKAIVMRDYHRPHLSAVSGSFPLSAYPKDLLKAVAEHAPLCIADARECNKLCAASINHFEGMQIRSLMVVPIFDDEAVVALLIVAMAEDRREWSEDEMTLAEIVAAQTRSVAESARLHLKEHRIATILQDALRPALPESVPGLDLASYYRAALDEASIGGDFLDVFAIDAGVDSSRCAIMIGDVSGKGLAAATQVATVRMMLRYALTRSDNVAHALQHLNDTLASRDWLIGFATLFVGVYDSRRGELEYVSCGHEPAMLRRAQTGVVEELIATGGAMGAYEGAVYESRLIHLDPSDQILLYTDGVSDLGPDRNQPLGPDGIAHLLSNAPIADADAMISYMRTEVERCGIDMVRDDICMLGVVVQPALAASPSVHSSQFAAAP